MRYLVTARLKPDKKDALVHAIESGTLGEGSIAGGEYVRDMKRARLLQTGDVRWVEVCYCPTPLMEEIPYWEEYFDLTRIRDAHDRRNCKHETGETPWACSDCDCTQKLEKNLEYQGERFIESLQKR